MMGVSTGDGELHVDYAIADTLNHEAMAGIVHRHCLRT